MDHGQVDPPPEKSGKSSSRRGSRDSAASASRDETPQTRQIEITLDRSGPDPHSKKSGKSSSRRGSKDSAASASRDETPQTRQVERTLDHSGPDPHSKKSGKSSSRKGTRDSTASSSRDQTPQTSHGEKKKRKSSPGGASQASTTPTAVGQTPPGLAVTEEVTPSKSAGSVPVVKEGKEQPSKHSKASLPGEKGAAEEGTRKASLRTTEHTSGKPATPKTSASAAEAAVDFPGGGPDLKAPNLNFLKRLIFPIEVIIVFVFAMVFTFIVGGIISPPQPPELPLTLSCPEESQALLHALNDTIKPCDNFYGYVCSKIDAGSPEPFSPLMKAAVTSALVSFAGMEFGATAAGMLSAALHKIPTETAASRGSGLIDYVRAIVLAGAIDVALPMTELELVRFFAMLSLKYKLPAIVSFKVSGNLLRLESNDGCFLDSANMSVINASELGAIGEILHRVVSLRDLITVEEDLANLGDTDDSHSQTHGIATSPFSGMSGSDWTAILNEFLFPVHPDVINVQQQRGDRLSQVIHYLTQARHPLALGYAIICTAMRTRDSVHQALVRTVPPLESTAFQALDICEIEDVVLAGATKADCRNEYIRDLFVRIRGMVATYAEKHLSLNQTARTTLAGKLSQLRVAFPQEMVASHVAVPAVSESFAANLIAARSFAFDVMREKVARNIPGRESLLLRSATRQRNVIYLPTNLYALVPNHCQRRGNDFPAVAMDLSFHLWSSLLEDFWPTEENWRMEPHLECFRLAYGNGSDSSGYRRITSATLALATVFETVLSGHRQPYLDIKGTQVSVRSFAFLLWLFDRCSFLPEWLKPEEVNLVLKHVAAFTTAFDCPKLNKCLGN